MAMMEKILEDLLLAWHVEDVLRTPESLRRRDNLGEEIDKIFPTLSDEQKCEVQGFLLSVDCRVETDCAR